MAGVLVNGGETRMLSLLVNKAGTNLANLTLRLFKNDFTPTETSVVGDLTEATFTGYAAISLASGDWTISAGAPSSAQDLKPT